MHALITYHDATVDGHMRVLKASWASASEYSATNFGPQIAAPKGAEGWLVYDRFWKDGTPCLVLSVRGD